MWPGWGQVHPKSVCKSVDNWACVLASSLRKTEPHLPT